MKRRNPYKVWTKEPHRNALNKQEYQPGQQNREIKKLVDLKRRNVGETRGEKLFEHILPLFSSSIYEKPRKSATCQGRGSNQLEAGKIIWEKTSIDWKWRLGPLSIEKLPIKATANPQIFTTYAVLRQFFVSRLQIRHRECLPHSAATTMPLPNPMYSKERKILKYIVWNPFHKFKWFKAENIFWKNKNTTRIFKYESQWTVIYCTITREKIVEVILLNSVD